MVQDDNAKTTQEDKAAGNLENNEINRRVDIYEDQNGNSGESNNTESTPQSQTIPGNKGNYISCIQKQTAPHFTSNPE